MSDRTPRATDTAGLLLGGDIAPGTRINEYVIEQRLATRGNGHVYQAIHVVLPRKATIKVMPAASSFMREIALELLREACIVDALDHPGIPRIYECGMLADRRPWIATELVPGDTLHVLLQRGVTCAAEVAALVRDVAEILDHAHRRGLVHRNVVPTSILIPTQARRFPVCLVDWSGARTHDSKAPLPMLPPAGSRPYIAPEQLSGEPADGRADVYSLGVITRELLRTARPGTAPPVFVALLDRMLSQNPADRPTSFEVADAAGWLAREIEPEQSVPETIAEDPTVPDRPARLITSEAAPSVAGEIQHD